MKPMQKPIMILACDKSFASHRSKTDLAKSLGFGELDLPSSLSRSRSRSAGTGNGAACLRCLLLRLRLRRTSEEPMTEVNFWGHLELLELLELLITLNLYNENNNNNNT